MSEKLTIRVNIVDRFYPLKVDRTEEEKIRNAAKKINETVLQYQKIYKDKDSQDFLAMAALQFVTKLVDKEVSSDLSPIINELKEIDAELSEYLIKE